MKNLYLFVAIAMFLTSCSKDVSEIDDPKTASPISDVPTHFDQKVLIESFTQTSDGTCPKADLIMDSLIAANPNRVYNVAFHIEDVMSDLNLIQSFSGTNYYDSVYNPGQNYPSGMVNRKSLTPSDISFENWYNNTNSTLNLIPSCGVALEAEAINENTLTLTVHVGFSAAMFGEYRIHAYLVENTVNSYDSLYDQFNDFSIHGATPDSLLPLYTLSNPIHLYTHKNVLRKVLTPAGVNGDPIPASEMILGNDYVVNYSVDVSGVNFNNSSIIVFVDKYALISAGHRIVNVQRVPLGETKDWN